MSTRTLFRKIAKTSAVLFLVFAMFLSNIPFGLFEYVFQSVRDANVVDVLWRAENDRSLADAFLVPKADAAVTPTGVLGFSETAANDNMQFLNYTSPSTYTDRGNSVDTTANANDLQHIRMEMAPTRDEMLSGQVEVNGTLHVTMCVGACDASGDWTEQLEIAGVNSTLTCDGTAGACERAYDIAYEQLGGRAVVFYGKVANDGIIYFNIWNGTSWVGEASFTFKSSSTADTEWVKVVADGDGLGSRRTDRILVMVEDNTEDLFAMIYDAGTIADLATMSATTFTSDNARNFDGAWESLSGDAVVVWGEGTTAATNPYRYKTYVNANDTWDGAAIDVGTVFSATNTGRWVNLASDPNTNIIAGTLEGSGADYRPTVWKADGTTEVWSFGTEDASTESILMNQTSVAWERYNSGTAFALFVNTDASTADVSDYQTWTGGVGFNGAAIDMPGAMGDDGAMWKVYSSPNSDEVMAVGIEFSDDLCFQVWSGSAWDADCTTTEYSTTLPPDTATASNEGFAFDFAYRWYSPWSRNWRFYDGTDTAATPTTALAAENTTPTDFNYTSGKARLRFSVAELSNMAQTDARKKLQYTTSNPDLRGTTWTDVDDPAGAGIWRYVDCNGGVGTCDDNTALSGTVLSGTPTAGWWTQDKDAAGGTVMDHSALQVRELEYSIEANGAAESTTYYFRMFDNDLNAPVFREQDNDGSNDCATAVCTYPSITTLTPPAVTITLSGTLYGLNESTQEATAGRVIRARIGTSTPGFFSTTTIAANGFWQINNIDTTGFFLGMPLQAWIDGDSLFNAFTFTKASSTSQYITGMDLYRNRITLKHEGFTGTSTTNADLATYDFDNDPDIKFTAVAGGALDVFKSQELHIAAGTEFEPGGAVTLHGNASTTNPDGDLHMAYGARQNGVSTSSTMILGANALTLAGNWLASSSAAFSGSGTVTFNSTSTQQKRIVATSTPFTTLTFNGSGGSWTFAENAATTTGAFTITAGTVTAPSTLLDIAGNYSNSGTFTHNSGTVLFNGATAQTLSGTMTSTSAFSGVNFSGAGTKSFGANAADTGDFIISSGSGAVTLPSSTLTISGNYRASSTMTHNSGTVVMNGTGKTLTPNASSFSALTLSGSITLLASTTAAGNVTLSGTVTAPESTLQMTGTGVTLVGGGNSIRGLWISTGGTTLNTSDLTVGTSTISSAATLTIASGRTLTATSTMTLTGILTGTGTTTFGTASFACTNVPSGGTLSVNVRLEATAGDCTMPARTYGANVEIYSNSSASARTVTMAASTHAISGALFVNAANTQNVTLAGNTNNPAVTVTGNIDFVGAGAGSEIVSAGSGLWDTNGNLDISDGTFTSSSNTLTIGGNYTNTGGTFTHNSGTTTFDGSSAQTLSGTMTGSSAFNHVLFLDVSATISANASTTNLTLGGPGAETTVTFCASGCTYGTETTTWAVPSDWNSADNTVEVIGGGGGGGGGGTDGTNGAAGGGAGAGGVYAKTVNVSLTPGATVTVAVGAAGGAGAMEQNGTAGGDTFFCNAISNCASIGGTAVVVGGKGGGLGTGAVNNTIGAGGTVPAGSVGSTINNGGAGGNGGLGDTANEAGGGGGGGGGAGGETGVGTAGSVGLNVTVNRAGAAGGNGGAGGTTGGGTAGTGAPSPGQANGTTGGVGGNGTNFGATLGAGGGAGGASGGGRRSVGGIGGAGGNYGAGGGGGGGTHDNSGTTNTGGVGKAGIIVITYTPLSTPTVTAPSGTLSVAGDFKNNNSTFTHNSGTTTINGTVAQALHGSMIGTSAFYNLEIINSAATTTFAAAASTTNNFYATRAGSKIAFAASATSTLQNLIINGQTPGSEIRLWSATPGTRWNLHVPGTRSISYASIMDSDACNSSGNIDASNGTNINAGNNVCWDFNAAAPVIDLVHYHFRADNGSETVASYLASEDTAVTAGVYAGGKVRLRFAVQNTGAASATDVGYRLEQASSTQSCAAWIAVPTSNTQNTHWMMSESSNVNNNASTTQFGAVTAPPGKSFVAGYVKTTENQTGGLTLTTTQYTELEYSMRSTAAVSTSAYYCFRLTNVGATTNFVYTVTPQITVSPGRPFGGGSGDSEGSGSGSQQGGGGAGGGGGGEGSGSGSQQGGGTPSGGGGDSG